MKKLIAICAVCMMLLSVAGIAAVSITSDANLVAKHEKKVQLNEYMVEQGFDTIPRDALELLATTYIDENTGEIMEESALNEDDMLTELDMIVDYLEGKRNDIVVTFEEGHVSISSVKEDGSYLYLEEIDSEFARLQAGYTEYGRNSASYINNSLSFPNAYNYVYIPKLVNRYLQASVTMQYSGAWSLAVRHSTDAFTTQIFYGGLNGTRVFGVNSSNGSYSGGDYQGTIYAQGASNVVGLFALYHAFQ